VPFVPVPFVFPRHFFHLLFSNYWLPNEVFGNNQAFCLAVGVFGLECKKVIPLLDLILPQGQRTLTLFAG
jgi:hypothetical protein